MTAIFRSPKQWRWYQWLLAVVALLYVLYVALSYLYLPGKLKAVVQTDVAQSLGRDIRVERIAFNPFTLSLTVDRFALGDRPRRPLLAFDKLFVNFDAWGSLFGWELRFSQVQLDSPSVAIERRKHGFNFSDILARLSRARSKRPQSKSKMALEIDDIRIQSGRFTFDDLSGATPAHIRFANITVGAKNLYLATGAKEVNPFRLEAAIPGGGTLALNGQYRADPLKVDTSIRLRNFELKTLKDFIANVVPVQLSNGRLSLQTQVDVAMDKTLQVLVRNGRVTVTDLALNDAHAKPPLLRGRELQVQGIALDLGKRRIHIGAVNLDGFETSQWLDAQGKPRIQPLLARWEKPTQSASAAAGKQSVKHWAIGIGKLALHHSRIDFQDRRAGLNASQQVQDLDLAMEDIRLEDGAQAPFQLSAVLDGTGKLQVHGQVTPMPFGLDLHYQLKGLALAPFNPYVEQRSWLHLQQGDLNADGSVLMGSAGPSPLTLDLNASIRRLRLQDARSGNTVLRWKALQLHHLQLDLAKRNVVIDKVALETPQVDAQMDADKKLNLATLMKPVPKEAAKPGSKAAKAGRESTSARPWKVAIHQIALRNGSARFRDLSIKPEFRAGLYDMQFQLNQLTSTGSTPATFRLRSKVDKYAPFNVKGTLAPLQRQPGFAFTSQLHGLEMPPLSPYSGTYIGYDLKSGRLALDLKYQLKGNELRGNNTIVAKQLYLGNSVKSKKAVHAPVALGLALLRDAHGVIDLDVGVSGDINNPGFSVSGVVLKALVNIVVKAAASPFRLLGALVGGKEDLGHVAFGAGSGTLDQASREKLRQLVQALAQRPQLAVTVRGSASTADDGAALQQQRVLEQIAALRKIPVGQLHVNTLLQDKANRKVLKNLNNALKLASEGARKDSLRKQDPKLKGEALIQAAYRQMLADVVSKQVISERDLLNLADQRALAIKQFLVEAAGLAHNRVRLLKTRREDLKGKVCKLGVEPL